MNSEKQNSELAAKPCCNGRDAQAFWRASVKQLAGFNGKDERVFVITLDGERRFKACHQITSRVFRSPVLFADEVIQLKVLDGIEEFILLHNRPGISPMAGTDDRARAVEIALAARRKNSSLLDYIIVGNFGDSEDKRFPEGFFSSHKNLARWVSRKKP